MDPPGGLKTHQIQTIDSQYWIPSDHNIEIYIIYIHTYIYIYTYILGCSRLHLNHVTKLVICPIELLVWLMTSKKTHLKQLSFARVCKHPHTLDLCTGGHKLRIHLREGHHQKPGSASRLNCVHVYTVPYLNAEYTYTCTTDILVLVNTCQVQRKRQTLTIGGKMTARPMYAYFLGGLTNGVRLFMSVYSIVRYAKMHCHAVRCSDTGQ